MKKIAFFVVYLYMEMLFSQGRLNSYYPSEPCSDWLPRIILKCDSANGKEVKYFLDYIQEGFIIDSVGVYFPEHLWMEIDFEGSMFLYPRNEKERQEYEKWMDKCYRLEVYYSLKYGSYGESHRIINPRLARYKVYEGNINFLDWWKYIYDEEFIEQENLHNRAIQVGTKVVIGKIPFKELFFEKKIYKSLDSCEYKLLDEYYYLYEPRYFLNQVIFEVYLYDEVGTIRCSTEYFLPVNERTHEYFLCTECHEW